MTLHPQTEPLLLRRGETLLEAGLRQGLALPYECRNGGCGACLCTVLHGSVDHGIYQRSALPESKRLINNGTNRHSCTSVRRWRTSRWRNTSKYWMVIAWQWL